MNYENVVLPDDYPDGLTVAAGETADNTTVLDGGVMAVQSDGFAGSTYVSGGGAVTIYSGGSADKLYISSAGNVVVSGSVTNLTHSGGYMEVWGGTISGGGAYGSQSTNTAEYASANFGSGAVLSGFSMTTMGSPLRGDNRTWYNIGWNQLNNRNGSAYAYNITVTRRARFQVNWGVAYNTSVGGNGWMLVERGGNAEGITVSGTNASNIAKLGIANSLGGVAKSISVYNFAVASVTAGSASDFSIHSGGTILVIGGKAGDVKLSGGSAIVSGGVVAGATLSSGGMTVSGGVVADAVISGGTLSMEGGEVSGTLLRTGSMVVSGGTAYDNTVVGGTLVMSGGTAVGGSVTGGNVNMYDGVMSDTAISGSVKVVLSGGTLADIDLQWGQIFSCYGGTFSGGMIARPVSVYTVSNFHAEDLTIASGGLLRQQTNTATGQTWDNDSIRNITVLAGGALRIYYGGMINSGFSGKLTLDLTGAKGCDTAMVQRNLSVFKNNGEVLVIASEEVGDYQYLLANLDNIATTLNTQIAPGTVISLDPTYKAYNPTLGQSYTFNYDSTAKELWLVTAPEAYTYTVAETAGALATTLNKNDRAAKWDSTTEYTAPVYLTSGMTTGNAWLEIAGLKDDAEATVYGTAAGDSLAGAINIKLTDGTLRNLAAGAAAGGSVKAVNFEMTGGELAGNTYAGGMGDVTEAANTTIAGGTLAAEKNFYAGALWNKQSTATSVGKVTLTVKGGELKGNVYGASAVKTGAIATADNDAAKHTVGDVTISLANGTATDHKFCVFAGGYATGTDSTKLASVYDVGDIDVSVTGGTWGDADDAWGGRGLFGGVFASGVKATAEDVTITITGGTFGNVYGGGWAQKNGVSVVDDVEITISGGTIANVFGGGTHSTSGGSTIVDDVSINISGGNITGDIFARGQADGDVVTGDEVSVTFTGATDFGCGVFGYTYVGGTANSDAVLSYTAYT
ncbi:MAG: hypothetical protein J6Y54_00405, partial [Lentisphaeria bacterium]|nr:hypothetical protein [Lentisphaeria bacterium]